MSKANLTVGSLFAGIGGFDLGFERAGFDVAWQVEIDPYCQKVLAKHWPKARRHDDVRTFPPQPIDDWRCDIIVGGFPCQDISNAGKRAGIEGERSGLWAEFARIIDVLRPRYVVVENVAALLERGMGRVLGDLAAIGYDAEWDNLPASIFGAPHVRSRLFIVAYPVCSGVAKRGGCLKNQTLDGRLGFDQFGGSGGYWRPTPGVTPNGTAYAWSNEPASIRVADGVPDRMDRLHGCGNAIVPQIAQWIGEQIKQHAGVIVNDKHLEIGSITRAKDAMRPRVEIAVTELP